MSNARNKEDVMKLAIAMLVAYLPFCWWMYKQAIEDLDETKTERHEQ